jgi:hypothetical protein
MHLSLKSFSDLLFFVTAAPFFERGGHPSSLKIALVINVWRGDRDDLICKLARSQSLFYFRLFVTMAGSNSLLFSTSVLLTVVLGAATSYYVFKVLPASKRKKKSSETQDDDDATHRSSSPRSAADGSLTTTATTLRATNVKNKALAARIQAFDSFGANKTVVNNETVLQSIETLSGDDSIPVEDIKSNYYNPILSKPAWMKETKVKTTSLLRHDDNDDADNTNSSSIEHALTPEIRQTETNEEEQQSDSIDTSWVQVEDPGPVPPAAELPDTEWKTKESSSIGAHDDDDVTDENERLRLSVDEADCEQELARKEMEELAQALEKEDMSMIQMDAAIVRDEQEETLALAHMEETVAAAEEAAKLAHELEEKAKQVRLAEQEAEEVAEQAHLEVAAMAAVEAAAELSRRQAEALEQAQREADAAEQALRDAEAAEEDRRQAEIEEALDQAVEEAHMRAEELTLREEQARVLEDELEYESQRLIAALAEQKRIQEVARMEHVIIAEEQAKTSRLEAEIEAEKTKLLSSDEATDAATFATADGDVGEDNGIHKEDDENPFIDAPEDLMEEPPVSFAAVPDEVVQKVDLSVSEHDATEALDVNAAESLESVPDAVKNTEASPSGDNLTTESSSDENGDEADNAKTPGATTGSDGAIAKKTQGTS